MSILDRALRLGEGKQFKQYAKRVEAHQPRGSPSSSCSTTTSSARQADALRERARNGEPLDDLLPETFAVVRETSRRTMGMRHFDVQMIGGMVLHAGSIAEMKTGEGKTLTATLAVALNALAGKGVHVVTVNDYLARRDAEWMSPLYNGPRPHGRRAAEHAALPGEARRLRVRHHVRHQLRVRLRLPARQHGDVAGGEGPARRADRRGRQADRHAPLRDRRRGRQHPHRRGADAADHLRRARAGRRLLRPLREARQGHEAGQAPGGHGPEDEEGVRRRLRLRVRREAQDGLGDRAAASRRPSASSASTTSTRPRTARSSTTSSSR